MEDPAKYSVKSLLPITIFLGLFLGSGVYFSLQGIENAFYKVSPIIAILPAIFIGALITNRTVSDSIDAIIEGARDKDIITMCLIFLLSGAFGTVTNAVGSVNSVIGLLLDFIPASFLLPGLFIITALMSTAMGSSMGVVAAATPLAIELAKIAGISKAIAVSTVISGAMFGDNLSLISDTTIAAIQTQRAKLQEKFIFNSKLAALAALLTIGILVTLNGYNYSALDVDSSYSLLKIFPYFLVVILAFFKINVLIVLTFGILVAALIGLTQSNLSVFDITGQIQLGFMNMQEILVLSLLVGSLSELMRRQGSIECISNIAQKILSRTKTRRWAELLVFAIGSIKTLCFANNTIAIIVSGPVAARIATKHKIPTHKSATWLDTSSCIIQGIIPYGAQVLLASRLSGIPPVTISAYVFYCYILGLVSLIYIFLQKKLNKGTTRNKC